MRWRLALVTGKEIPCDHLRQLMIEELQRRNFAETTIRSYVHGVEHFSRYFHRSPDELGPEHIRKYQAMLLSKLKFSPNTVIQRLGALRFFYIKVLKKNWSVAETPYPRKVRLPQILSPEEVTRLIDAADSTFHQQQANLAPLPRVAPACGGAMCVIERISAADLLLRSPPTLTRGAA